jgi:spore maturation protein CgeB
MHLRVLLVGEFDDATHAHMGLRRRALERLGCAVSTFDLARGPGLIDRVRGVGSVERLRRAVQQAVPDLVLVIEGASLDPVTVANLKRESAAIWANWFPGDLRSAEAIERCAIAYDRIFVAGTDLVERLRGVGAPRVDYLPLACDPSVHRPMRARDQFRANVVFVGAATPHREALLSGLVEFGLAVWGRGWRRTTLRDYCRGEALPLHDYVRAYAGASVAINIHQGVEDPGGTDRERGCNQRLFELAAIGSPQVVDYRADLPRHFEPGTEVLVFHTPAELKSCVAEALQDPVAAEQVAMAGRRRAIAEHTYMHRLASLLESVGRRGDRAFAEGNGRGIG